MLKKEHLFDIKKFIDEILNNGNLNFIEVSNSLLHIHRFQSDFLSRYSDLFIDKNKSLDKAKNTYSKISFFSGKNSYFRERKESRFGFDFLVVSHFVPKLDNQAYNDFYFSQIIESLLKVGYSVKVVYINDVDDEVLRISNLENSRLFYDSIKKNISPFTAVFFLGGILFQSLKYRFASLFISNSGKKSFYKIISRMESSWSNLCTSYNIGKIVKKEKPKFLITTFEGQAYERLIYFFSKKYHKDVIRIGYLHAAIFEFQFSVKQKLGHSFDPDIIFTQGEFSKKTLETSFLPSVIKVSSIGAPREIKFDFESIKNNSILIIPSGIEHEVFFLLSFSLNLAQNLTNFTFYFRLHPSFDLVLFNEFLINRKIPENFILSKNSLNYDSSFCKFSLYRDSTAILTSVSLGSIPIFIRKIEEDILVNPLYGLKDFIPSVSSPEDFIYNLERLNSLNNIEYVNAIKSIISQYNEEELLSVISNCK
jgi:hypothetical protein